MEIKMNSEEWSGLANEEQQQIEEILRGFFKGAQVVPDPEAPRRGLNGYPAEEDRGFCEIGCNIAEAGAKAACNAIGNPALREACIAAATAAGELCRSKC